ncbi:MAG TPA: hypothetical protein P5181_00505 [Dermatophilaceae bacterium]|nr:hypothetical protein [Dermatophilaceae bacterium]
MYPVEVALHVAARADRSTDRSALAAELRGLTRADPRVGHVYVADGESVGAALADPIRAVLFVRADSSRQAMSISAEAIEELRRIAGLSFDVGHLAIAEIS